MNRKGNFGSETRQSILAKRREKLLRLRRAGYSIREIALRIPEYGGDTLDAREKAVRADLRRILRRMIDEPARELLALQYARYERLLRALWRDALSGDLQASDRVLTLLRNQSKLIQSMGGSSSAEGSDVDKWLSSLMSDVEEAESEDIEDGD